MADTKPTRQEENARIMYEVLRDLSGKMRRWCSDIIITQDTINGEPFARALQNAAEVVGYMTMRSSLDPALAEEFARQSVCRWNTMPHHQLMLGEVHHRYLRHGDEPDYEVDWAPGASLAQKEAAYEFYKAVVIEPEQALQTAQENGPCTPPAAEAPMAAKS